MQTLIKALKATGEVTRMRILAALSHFELTVTELVYLLGQSQPRVSRHLKLLVDAKLLERYQEGSWVFHRLYENESSNTSERALAQKLVQLIDHNDPELIKDRAKLAQIKQANAKLAADYFQKQAKDWDKIRQLIGSDNTIEQNMLDCVTQDEIGFMVDLGTGTGRILEIFAPRIQKGIGYDSSHAMLNVARANLAQLELSHCQVRQSDIRDLPLQAGSVDLVTLHQVLHYIDNPIAVIQEAVRILKPSGDILIVDFAKHQLEFMRTEHAHRRLGFSQSEVQFWCDSNDLKLISHKRVTQHSKKQGLDVDLWHLKRSK